jgi:hypothetical protein
VSGATGTQRAAGPRIRPHVGLRAGVDIGATKTLVVLRDDADGLLAEAETATPARRGGDAIMDTAAELVRGVLAEVGADPAALTGVGVGAAGVISAGGMVTAAGDSFSGWVGTKIDLELSRRLDRVPRSWANWAPIDPGTRWPWRWARGWAVRSLWTGVCCAVVAPGPARSGTSAISATSRVPAGGVGTWRRTRVAAR